MSLAPSALVQLDSACELFQKVADGFRATKVLVSEFYLQSQAVAHQATTGDHANIATEGTCLTAGV